MSLDQYPIQISTELKQIISSELACNYRIVPAKLSDSSIQFIVDEEHWNENFAEELELILGIAITPLKTNYQDFQKRLSVNYRKNSDSSQSKITKATYHTDFLDQIINEAQEISSSDIHFEVFEHEARVRLRIDGHLIEKYKIEKENYLELVNKVKIKSNLDITEKRLPQDGRIFFDDISIRVSVLPTLHGEKMVMRLLGNDAQYLEISKLGMSEDHLLEYSESLKAGRGIILISGPTGSGKTTTLYASLKQLNQVSRNIVTIEDPIEYTLDGINQVQLKEEIGLTFKSALKTFLRQDPDIIMLGEIRDAETAEMAIRASLTGHLVLSTIHTNSAIGTISRLVDMGVPAFLIAETLKISVAQRLVRKLCNSCKESKEVDHNRYPNEKIKDIHKAYEAKGCEECHYTGYTGRRAIYEMITNTESLSSQIKNDAKNLAKNYSEIEGESFKTLVVEALLLVKEGVTSIDEIYPILVD